MEKFLKTEELQLCALKSDLDIAEIENNVAQMNIVRSNIKGKLNTLKNLMIFGDQSYSYTEHLREMIKRHGV